MNLTSSTIDFFHWFKRRLLPKAHLRKWPVVGGVIGWIRRKRLANPVTIGGSRFYAGDGDTLGLLSTRDYCPDEQKLYSAVIQPGDTCVELGSNIGLFSVLFGRLAGEHGRVFAFEPSPMNAALLRRNLALNGITNVEVIEKAVSNQRGTVSLHLSRCNCGDNRIYSSDLDSSGIVTVATIKLDEFFPATSGGIDFLKMDIQGAEEKALDGMVGLLRNRRIAKILMEFWPYGLIRSGSDPERVLTLLRESGHSLYEATADGRVRPVSELELIRRFPASKQDFANVYAALVPPPQSLMAD